MNKKGFNSKLKKLVSSSNVCCSVANWLLRAKRKMSGLRGVKIENNGYGSFKKDVMGRNNIIQIGKATRICKSIIRIRGNGNKIVIGKNCKIRKNCSIWITGNNCSIVLGDNVTMQHNNHFNVHEDGRCIIIGNDCMLSNNIIVRTSDDHGIFDLSTKKRLNEAKDIKIGNHVWIAPNSRVYKGAVIEDGSIIGSNTLVTKRVPANTLVCGMPARIVKENIEWQSSLVYHEEEDM